MAWSTPATWVAGAVLTAAQLNAQLRDNLAAAFPLGVDAWTSFTPTLSQSATPSKTTTYGKYFRVGRLVVAQYDLAVTGSGTAGFAVLIGLPVTAAGGGSPSVGSVTIYDASTTTRYNGTAELFGTTTFQMSYNAASAAAWGASPSIALASGDIIRASIMFEAAT